MRGCLSVIVLALVFLTGAIWFGGPPIASAVVKATLTGTGFTSDTLEVEVTSDPPLKLAVGRADRVTIQATGVHWNDVRLATLSLRLGSVDLIARTAGTADGSLDGVQFSGPSGKPILADVVLSGAADSARTTITVDATSVSAAAVEAFAASFGLRPSAATLAAPDVIRVTLGGMSISGHLSVDASGSVIAKAGGATVVLMTPDPKLPLRLTDVSVTAQALVLRGTLDIGSLMR